MTDDLGQRTVPASALRELVAEWREREKVAGPGHMHLTDCADELEELIE